MGQVGLRRAGVLAGRAAPSDPGELRVFESVLVALADHGFTPTVIAARLTLTGAPESVQGAMAAGLLGGGSRFLGVTEDAGRFLSVALAAHAEAGDEPPTTDEGWDDLARDGRTCPARVRALRPRPRATRVHKNGDPRTPVLMRIAEEEGLLGPHLRLFEAVGRVHPELLGRTLPLNGAGVCGAALCDLGFDVDILRGFALLARAAGLVGHIAEEMRRPVGLADLRPGRP